MRYGSDWVPPWKPGLAQTPCRAGEDCHAPSPALVVAMTTVDGWCVSCAKRLGIKQGVEDDGPSSEQLSLEGPWGADREPDHAS
jgi:hypothetical protein